MDINNCHHFPDYFYDPAFKSCIKYRCISIMEPNRHTNDGEDQRYSALSIALPSCSYLPHPPVCVALSVQPVSTSANHRPYQQHAGLIVGDIPFLGRLAVVIVQDQSTSVLHQLVTRRHYGRDCPALDTLVMQAHRVWIGSAAIALRFVPLQASTTVQTLLASITCRPRSHQGRLT